MKAYRIYLGARNTVTRSFKPKDLNLLTSILNSRFDGWSIFDAIGSWKGEQEHGKVITLFVGLNDKSAVLNCAKELRAAFNQYVVTVEDGGKIESCD